MELRLAALRFSHRRVNQRLALLAARWASFSMRHTASRVHLVGRYGRQLVTAL